MTVTPIGGLSTSTTFSYDALNRLESVTDSTNQTTTYSYDKVGHRASVSYPNGNTTVYGYDTLNRLTRLTSTDSLGNTLTDYQYTLDASGHRIQIIEASGRVSDFIYDDLYRLTGEAITDAVNGDYNASYQYDKVGNRTYSTINGIETLYSYDDNDRLTQQGGESYNYDANGNTLSKTIDGDTSTYTYDAKNHLNGASLTVSAITTNTGYDYDIDGIRISKTENGNSIDYLVDHNRDYAQVLKETDQGTLISLDYLYGDDLISQSQNSADEKYYLYDGLGSTRALSDTSGATTDTYNYEAFGSILNQTGSTANQYLFTGEQYDQTLDQQYLRARYYDPHTARFTQMDDWMGNNKDPITLNKYIYADSNPINGIDPSGNITLMGQMAAVTTAGILVGSAQQTLNVFSLDRKESSGSNGFLTYQQLGILALMSMSTSPALWKMVFKDGDDSYSVARVEEALEIQINDLRNRDATISISVPLPPRKKRWNTCIARAQDLGRSTGSQVRYGWGWGMSRDFQIAKNNAVQMANSSIGAVDTHHTQWRCIDSKGKIRRP